MDDNFNALEFVNEKYIAVCAQKVRRQERLDHLKRLTKQIEITPVKFDTSLEIQRYEEGKAKLEDEIKTAQQAYWDEDNKLCELEKSLRNELRVQGVWYRVRDGYIRKKGMTIEIQSIEDFLANLNSEERRATL